MLQPTLWRTARALANRTRLRILRHLMEVKTPQTVSQVAADLQLKLPRASLYLRQLNARGMLSAERHGRWVYYRPEPDPTLPDAEKILKSLRKSWFHEHKSTVAIFRDLTAFTHPRRCVIIALLNGREYTLSGLMRKARMSRYAVVRHLDKLAERGYVVRKGDGYRSALPEGALARALREAACRHP
jgi:DNA-binding transcriptional ArsR family regulator